MIMKLILVSLLCMWMLAVVQEIGTIKNRLNRLEENAYKKGENKA